MARMDNQPQIQYLVAELSSASSLAAELPPHIIKKSVKHQVNRYSEFFIGRVFSHYQSSLEPQLDFQAVSPILSRQHAGFALFPLLFH